MSVFDDHQAALNRAVFDEFAQPVNINGFVTPINAVINLSAAEVEGVTYESNTAQIYNSDAALANGQQLVVRGRIFEVDAPAERDELTTTYLLRST